MEIPPEILSNSILFFPFIDRSWIWPSPNDFAAQQISQFMLSRLVGTLSIPKTFLEIVSIKEEQGMVVWKGERPWDALNNILLQTTDSTDVDHKKREYLNPIEEDLNSWFQLINSRPPQNKKEMTEGSNPSRPSFVKQYIYEPYIGTPKKNKEAPN